MGVNLTLQHMADDLIAIEALQLFDKSPGNQVWLHHGGPLEKPLCTNSLIAKTEIGVCCGCGLIQSALME